MGVMELRPGTGTCLPPNHLRGKAEPVTQAGAPQGLQTAGGNPRMRTQPSQPSSPVFFPCHQATDI